MPIPRHRIPRLRIPRLHIHRPHLTTHPWRWLLWILILTLVAALLEYGWHELRGHVYEPAAEARWIWLDGVAKSGSPVAFLAARELELDRQPATARLSIAADETYLLYVNGQLVGSDSYREEAPVDLYEIAPYLEAGTNRLLVELRSGRGAGGLLAELEIGDDGNRVVETGPDWRLFRTFDPELFSAAGSLAGGEAPVVWGEPPEGRWRLAKPAGLRPIPAGFASPLEPIVAQHFRLPGAGQSWRTVGEKRRRFPPQVPVLIFDWGKVVEGYLKLELKDEVSPPGLLFFGESDPPKLAGEPPSEVLIAIPGQAAWRDAHPRRFRFAAIVGVHLDAWPAVDSIDAELVRALTPPAARRGVFGIEPPVNHRRLENEIWDRVYGED